MSSETVNELTFVGWLGNFTAVRFRRRRDVGEDVLIAEGNVEEKQIDPDGTVRRCDIRLSTASGRKLISGEVKRPEVPEGRDPRNDRLVRDARRKAVARGLPYYFTCNMASVVLFEVAATRADADREVREYDLAPLSRSTDAIPYKDAIDARWCEFLEDIEARLRPLQEQRPMVTRADVISLRNAIDAITDEAIARAVVQVAENATLCEALRNEAVEKFSFSAALRSEHKADFRRELSQLLRFGGFVAAQKMLLYRVLQEAGPRRANAYTLDALSIPTASTDPVAVRSALDAAWSHAIARTGDYETAFLPQPLSDLVFIRPRTSEQAAECRVGDVWNRLQVAVSGTSWLSISRNLVGFLYEAIIDPSFRKELGQFYTREDIVDILIAFAIREPGDVVMDPASGAGSFLWAAYRRKRDLGGSHEQALEETWAFEISAFAAGLSTITLATADTTEAAAYPRVVLKDFFDARPQGIVEIEIPDATPPHRLPQWFDAIVGNPPYISYRHQRNQTKVLQALVDAHRQIALPKFSGKSDAYGWFLVHATQFLKEGGRLGFVVSSAILFADYGLPLVRFIGRHFRIIAVIDSMVERWFPEADTNAVLLLLERCEDAAARGENRVRFIRLRRPLGRLLPPTDSADRRQVLEDFIDALQSADCDTEDPRMTVNLIRQGEHGGLDLMGRVGETEDEEDDGTEDDQ